MKSQIIKESLFYNPAIVKTLAEQLYSKLKKGKPTELNELTLEDCIVFINRTDGFIREKSVIEDNLAKEFPNVRFEESDPELDHAGDIDYLGWVGEKAFGIQIKPITATANFGNYSATERMKASFKDFSKKYGGNVFVVFSEKEKIKNVEVIAQITAEIELLSK